VTFQWDEQSTQWKNANWTDSMVFAYDTVTVVDPFGQKNAG
jgi:hypothetical protein